MVRQFPIFFQSCRPPPDIPLLLCQIELAPQPTSITLLCQDELMPPSCSTQSFTRHVVEQHAKLPVRSDQGVAPDPTASLATVPNVVHAAAALPSASSTHNTTTSNEALAPSATTTNTARACTPVRPTRCKTARVAPYVAVRRRVASVERATSDSEISDRDPSPMRTSSEFSALNDEDEPGVDINFEDEEMPIGLLPKPTGEAGRPGRGGYNLEKELRWSAEEFKEFKVGPF
jgi:hypothetical protein